ncbi:undecaprenyl/decaprenyl-phosphate alpha-N-acetylglucosaminyl 1-phosphate transferase [Candidatus Microgenomates bacterium]|nr:undecaprenyl/decaprenyl-phosphate alpha-N-acetylglucosaminyl 1-phosphate transferase [Candidatus Microgenomates bacterium]
MKMVMIAFLFSFLISFSTTPLVIKLAKKLKLVDDPKKRKHPAHTHKGIIPRGGGLSLYLGIAIASLFFLSVNKVLLGILLGGGLTTLIGLRDDKKDISPYSRFFMNFLVAGLAVAAGVGIPYITNPFNGIIPLDTWQISFSFFGPHTILVWADIFALVWIVWTMNIIGWSGGVDGQMPGFVAIAAVVLGVLSLRFSAHDISQQTITILCFITAGSFLGFLPFNFYPQKIMPGYGGKTLAGFMLASLSILSWGKVGTALLVLGLPMIDAGYIFLTRIAKGHSPVWGDRNHLHHRLLEIGWGRRRIAVFYWFISALLGIIALSLNSQQKLFAFILLALFIGGFILWLNFLKLIRG